MKSYLLIFLLLNYFINYSQVVDLDGNEYKTVQIGHQNWLEKNLEVTTFRNGDSIPHIQSFEKWMEAGAKEQPAWCYYENNTDNGVEFGKLYNWYAVTDPRGIGPEGWHVATSEEWIDLISILGGNEIAPNKLKSVKLWDPHEYDDYRNCNGNNISGLNIKPSGGRFHEAYIDYFYHLGNYAFFWIPETDEAIVEGKSFELYKSGRISINHNYRDIGMAVRCVEDIKVAQLVK